MCDCAVSVLKGSLERFHPSVRSHRVVLGFAVVVMMALFCRPHCDLQLRNNTERVTNNVCFNEALHKNAAS